MATEWQQQATTGSGEYLTPPLPRPHFPVHVHTPPAKPKSDGTYPNCQSDGVTAPVRFVRERALRSKLTEFLSCSRRDLYWRSSLSHGTTAISRVWRMQQKSGACKLSFFRHSRRVPERERVHNRKSAYRSLRALLMELWGSGWADRLSLHTALAVADTMAAGWTKTPVHGNYSCPWRHFCLSTFELAKTRGGNLASHTALLAIISWGRDLYLAWGTVNTHHKTTDVVVVVICFVAQCSSKLRHNSTNK